MKQSDHKRKIVILVVLLLGILLVGVGASFALFTYSKKGEKTNTIQAGDLYFTYTEDETVGNGIVIENGLPMSDDQGKNSSEYFDFTIKSTTGQSTPINYEIVAEKQDTSTFSGNHIKMYLTEVNGSSETPTPLFQGETVPTFGDLNNTTIVDANGKTIYIEDILENTSNYEKHFRLRMWISDTANSTIGGKWAYSGRTFSVKINVYANPTRKELAMMRSWYSESTSDFHAEEYRTKITSVTFSNRIDIPEGAISWDVSQEENSGQVMAWVIDDGKGTSTYALTIAGNGEVGGANLDYLFYNFSAVETIDLSHFDTSKTIDMNGMFSFCSILTNLDVSNFDTSSVIYMANMFAGCSSLISLDLSNFDTSKVTLMDAMFGECSNLVSLDVSSFDMSNVESMGSMFYGCIKLVNVDVSNFDTSNILTMDNMFAGCSSLTSLDLSNFDTSKVTNMGGMFSGCSGLTILDLSNFDTSSIENMSSMFDGCSSLTSLDLSNFDTSKVTDMEAMFAGCSSLTGLDVSNFNTSKVTNMGGMFVGCSSLTSLDLSNFDTSSVTIMFDMFNGCSGLVSLDLSNFDTSKVTNMGGMFNVCSGLTSLDLSHFDTSNVTGMQYMFDGCSSLTSLDFRNASFTSVSTSEYMFNNVPSAITVTVKDTAAKTFIETALGTGVGTVTIA